MSLFSMTNACVGAALLGAGLALNDTAPMAIGSILVAFASYMAGAQES